MNYVIYSLRRAIENIVLPKMIAASVQQIKHVKRVQSTQDDNESKLLIKDILK